MASAPARAMSDAVGSVDALKALRKLETEGAARLAELQFEGRRALSALTAEAEGAVAQARTHAEREAEQVLSRAQQSAEAEALEIVRRGEEEAQAVGAAATTHVLERRIAILDAVLGEFLDASELAEE